MQGLLYINGRVTDMYISGGLNVHPPEAEEILLEDPRIGEAAVVGMPHPKWGECGIAVIVFRDRESVAERDVHALLDCRLASYKHSKQTRFGGELPKPANGKSLKREIDQQLRSE